MVYTGSTGNLNAIPATGDSTIIITARGWIANRSYTLPPQNGPMDHNRSTNMHKTIIVCLLTLSLFCSLSLAADGTIYAAVVKSLKGKAAVTRNGGTVTATKGMEIQVGDIVKTDAQGAIGLVFSDDTVVSMGPDSELTITDYMFEPREKRLSLIIRILRGTLSFLSGQITKLAPKSVQLVTPSATIGVRGTHVLIKVE